MHPLNRQQRATIEAYLDEQGLTLPVLRHEMMDHLICDIESYLIRGYAFEEAWQLTTEEIPARHFKELQIETMETINRRFNLSRGFGLLALASLLAASLFKLLHLQYSDLLLFVAFGAMVAALVTGAVSGARLHQRKGGRLMLTGVIVGVVLFLLTWCMQVLQLPGSGPLRMVTAPFLVILFSALTVYFRTKSSRNDNILKYLLEKHTPGISRFLVILLVFGTILKLLSIVLGYEASISNVVLALVIGGAGLQFFTFQWQYEPKSGASVGSYGTQVALIVGFAAFLVPTLAYNAPGISLPVKLIAAAVFYLAAGGVIISESGNRTLSSIIVIGSWIYILTWIIIRLGLVNASESLLFNIPVLIVLVGGLLASYQYRTLMMYMVLVVAHFVYFY